MSYNTIITALFLCIVLSIKAQDTYTWEKIPVAGIKMKDYPADTNAAALVLADIGRISVSIRSSKSECFFERKKRIKILKPAGFQYADVAIPIYVENDAETLLEFEAHIYNSTGLARTIEKKDAFLEKSSGQVMQLKFAFPEVQVGSVIEYRYLISKKNFFELPEWYFQQEIPVLWSELSVTIPSLLEYITLINGTPPQERAPTSEREQVLNIPDAIVSTVSYYQKNMPALRPDGYITTMADYYSRIRFQLQASRLNGYREEVFSSWEKTAKELINHEFFGKKYLRKAGLDAALAELSPQLLGITKPEEQLQKIHQFVTHHMAWNGYHRFLVDEPLDKVFVRKLGSSAELNLLLCGLLNAYNITAHPMLLSTREHGQVFQDYPLIDQFNSVIVQAQVGEKTVLLDATHPYLAPGWVREDALNNSGWVVDPKNPRWDDILPGKSSSTYSFNLLLDETGQLNGKMSRAQDGYEAAKSREKLKDEKAQNTKDKKATLPLAEIAQYDSIQVRDLDELNKTLITTARIKLPESLSINGELAYFSPVLVPFFAENPFKVTNRAYPVDIPYPLSQRQILNLSIPEKFKLEELPQTVNLSLPNNGGRFSYQVQLLGNRILVTTQLQINQLSYSAAEYQTLKGFFDLVIEKQQEQLVFKIKE